MTVLAAFQKKLYEILSADGALTALITGIHDQVPEQAVVPYLVFTSAVAEEDDTAAGKFRRVRFVIRSYTGEGGRKKSDDIAARLLALLHRQPMTLASGYDVVWQRVVRTSSQLLGDGRSWRGEVEIAALIEITA